MSVTSLLPPAVILPLLADALGTALRQLRRFDAAEADALRRLLPHEPHRASASDINIATGTIPALDDWDPAVARAELCRQLLPVLAEALGQGRSAGESAAAASSSVAPGRLITLLARGLVHEAEDRPPPTVDLRPLPPAVVSAPKQGPMPAAVSQESKGSNGVLYAEGERDTHGQYDNEQGSADDHGHGQGSGGERTNGVDAGYRTQNGTHAEAGEEEEDGSVFAEDGIDVWPSQRTSERNSNGNGNGNGNGTAHPAARRRRSIGATPSVPADPVPLGRGGSRLEHMYSRHRAPAPADVPSRRGSEVCVLGNGVCSLRQEIPTCVFLLVSVSLLFCLFYTSFLGVSIPNDLLLSTCLLGVSVSVVPVSQLCCFFYLPLAILCL